MACSYAESADPQRATWPSMLVPIYYTTEGGQTPYQRWLNRLDDTTAHRIMAGVKRCADDPQRLATKGKSLGGGLHEIRLPFGAGYRVYYTITHRDRLILLGGSDKSNQQREIEHARERLADWRRREN